MRLVGTTLALLMPAVALAQDTQPEPKPAAQSEQPADNEPIANPDFIAPTVLMQLWGTAWDQDESEQADPSGYGDPEADPGLSFRRLRIGLEGQRGPIDFNVELGFSAPYDSLSVSGQGVGLSADFPTFEVANAYVRGRAKMGPGEGRLSAGVVRLPFGRERFISSRDLTFQERSVATNWLSPAQQLGLLADYELDMGLRIQTGLYNGGGTLFGDDNYGVLVGSRVEYARGDTYRTFGQAEPFDVGIGGAFFYNFNGPLDVLSFEGDVFVRVWRFSLLGEMFQSILKLKDTTISPPTITGDTIRRGATAQLSYWQPMSIGSLEIAARMGWLDDNIDLQDNGDVLIVHGGLTWRDPIPSVDFGVGYIHRAELQGRAIPNDTLRFWMQFDWPGPNAVGRIPLKPAKLATP